MNIKKLKLNFDQHAPDHTRDKAHCATILCHNNKLTSCIQVLFVLSFLLNHVNATKSYFLSTVLLEDHTLNKLIVYHQT